ncbi:MAG: HopJ type III effector protein [Spirosomataceae bacterium]
MTIENLLEKINNNPSEIEFTEVIATIDANYDFTPTAFQNGETRNEAGQNNGSCKLFSFAKIQGLDQNQTLACFGGYYKDVLNTPDATDHQNIRNFMKFGWGGIKFEGQALTQK